MTSLKLRVVLGAFFFLLSGLALGIGLLVRLLVPIFSEVAETYPERYPNLMQLSDMGWIMIIIGIVAAILGCLELWYVIKTKQSSIASKE